MTQVTPADLVLKCYGYRTGNIWVGHCIDLDIAVQAGNIVELKHKMEAALSSYVDSVLDTDDKESIPRLLSRKAPLLAQLKYQAIRLVVAAHYLRKYVLTFQEALPFHMGRACSC